MHFARNSGPSETRMCGQLVKRYVPKLGAFGKGGVVVLQWAPRDGALVVTVPFHSSTRV